MSEVNNSLPLTESGALAEVVTLDSCHIVLETSPPEYVDKVSRYLNSTYGQNRQDEVSNGPPEADSDSGESLFITQKPATQPVRSRRSRYSERADSSPRHRDLSENGDASSSSSSDEAVSKRCDRQKWKFKLPVYRFLFLTEKKCKPQSKMIQIQQNRSLHNFSTGGFLKCVQKRWEACQRGDDEEPFLPTVDIDGESISPLTEEEEGSENEDIKVVDRKLFAVPIKTKGQQKTWGCQSTQTRKDTNGRRETVKILHKVSNQPATSVITPESAEAEQKQEASVDKLRNSGEMCSLQKSQQHHNKRSTEESEPQTDVRQEQNLPQTAPPAANETNTDMLSCESTVKKRKKKKKDKGDHPAASVNVETVSSPKSQDEDRAEPLVAQISYELELNGEHLFEKPLYNGNGLEHAQTDSQDAKKKKKMCKNEANNVISLELEEDSVSENSRKKKKKRRSSKNDVEQIQTTDVPELLSDDFERQRKKKKRKREKQNTISEEEHAPKETLESSFVEGSTHKKKRKSPSNDTNQEQEEGLHMNSVNDNTALSESTEIAMKKREKKKKKKTLVEGVDNSYNAEEVEKVANEDEVQETAGGLQHENAEAVIRKKKKKKKKKASEDNTGQNDDSVSAQEKEKSSSFLAESLSFVAPAAKLDVNAANLEAESKEMTKNVDDLNNNERKKKKKRKRKISEGQSDAEKNNEADFQVPNSTCLVRGEHTGPETEVMTQLESLESAEDAGLFSTDEAVILKRKKKKKKSKDETCHAIQESPSGATEETGSVDKQAETSSDRIMKNKKLKRRLYSPSEDFFSDV